MFAGAGEAEGCSRRPKRRRANWMEKLVNLLTIAMFTKGAAAVPKQLHGPPTDTAGAAGTAGTAGSGIDCVRNACQQNHRQFAWRGALLAGQKADAETTVRARTGRRNAAHASMCPTHRRLAGPVQPPAPWPRWGLAVQ